MRYSLKARVMARVMVSAVIVQSSKIIISMHILVTPKLSFVVQLFALVRLQCVADYVRSVHYTSKRKNIS